MGHPDVKGTRRVLQAAVLSNRGGWPEASQQVQVLPLFWPAKRSQP